MKIIGINNEKGGVTTTTLAAHLSFLGTEFGLSVAGAYIGTPGDLRHWLQPAKIPCFDARREKLPTDLDLLVLDVYSQSKFHEVLRPDIWLVPVNSTEADRRAVALAPRLHGEVRRVRICRYEFEVSPELEDTNVVLPYCQAVAATGWSLRPVWAESLGASSAGARAIRELGAELFVRIGLLPSEHAPPLCEERDPEVNELDALRHLTSFFEEMEALKAAVVHEPKPWMIECAKARGDQVAAVHQHGRSACGSDHHSSRERRGPYGNANLQRMSTARLRRPGADCHAIRLHLWGLCEADH